MATTTPNTCPTCEGSGEYPEGEICTTCLGRSTVPIRGLEYKKFKEFRTRLSDIEDKVDDVLDKCNDILEAIQES